MKEQRCENCFYWDQLTPEAGLCRRFAPNPVTVTKTQAQALIDNCKAEWPETHRIDFCGEHKSTEDLDA